MKQKRSEPLSIKKNTLWNSAGSLFYLGCQWLTTVLVVLLSPNYANSGSLAFAMATGIVFASIALFSIRTYQVSDLTEEYSSANYVAFRFITIVGGALFCVIYLLVITQDMALIAASLVYLIFKADETFADVLYGVEQRGQRMDYIGKSQLLRGIASLIGFSVPLALTENLYAAIIGMALFCIAITLFYDIPRAKIFDPIKPKISKAKVLHLTKTCFPAMLATVFASGITTIVRQQFGITYGEEALGVYAAIATPAVLIQVAANYLYSPWIGELAKTALKSRKNFMKMFSKIFFVLILVMVALIALLIPFGDWFLQLLYGESIASSTYIFPFVLIATGCIGILFFVNNILIILRSFRFLLIANLIGVLCAAASSSFFTNLYHMNGVNYSIVTGAILAIAIALVGIIISSRKSFYKTP